MPPRRPLSPTSTERSTAPAASEDALWVPCHRDGAPECHIVHTGPRPGQARHDLSVHGEHDLIAAAFGDPSAPPCLQWVHHANRLADHAVGGTDGWGWLTATVWWWDIVTWWGDGPVDSIRAASTEPWADRKTIWDQHRRVISPTQVSADDGRPVVIDSLLLPPNAGVRDVTPWQEAFAADGSITLAAIDWWVRWGYTPATAHAMWCELTAITA